MKTILSLSLLIFGAAASEAGPILYNFTVNTSALNGTSGNLDFQFNPGGVTSQGATAMVSLFSTDGTLGSPAVLTGDVTPGNAALPGSFTLGNTTSFNDLFQPITFGNTVSFDVLLSGPALSSPNGTATMGSVFAFSLYDQAGTVPLLTSDPSGAVGDVQVNIDGSTTPQALPNGTSPSVATITVVTPEPVTGLLVLGGLGLVAIRMRCK